MSLARHRAIRYSQTSWGTTSQKLVCLFPSCGSKKLLHEIRKYESAQSVCAKRNINYHTFVQSTFVPPVILSFSSFFDFIKKAANYKGTPSILSLCILFYQNPIKNSIGCSGLFSCIDKLANGKKNPSSR